jgi:hypothetical protein
MCSMLYHCETPMTPSALAVYPHPAPIDSTHSRSFRALSRESALFNTHNTPKVILLEWTSKKSRPFVFLCLEQFQLGIGDDPYLTAGRHPLAKHPRFATQKYWKHEDYRCISLFGRRCCRTNSLQASFW